MMYVNTINQYSLILSVLIATTLSYPYAYRNYRPRTTTGRIKEAPVPNSLLDYINTYNADLYRNQQSQYGVPEYEPSPYEGRISYGPAVNPATVSAVLNYLSQVEPNQYSYDYNTPNSYTDDEGTWYDDVSDNYPSNNDNFDRSSQDAAIIQLYLDHLNGKYDLDDLMTLEREAAMEDNTENQLQAYRTQKKSMESRIKSPKSILPFRQGQKEEALMVPAIPVRKPMAKPILQHINENVKETTSTPSSSDEPATGNGSLCESCSGSNPTKPSTTMEPFVKSAYDALKRYLNKERIQRQNADESSDHPQPQKRFVSDPESLTQQLASLKKTAT